MREKLSETELPHSFKPVIRFSKCKKFRKDAAGRYLKAAFDGLIIIYGETHWLKEMYQAELVVTNNSLVDTLEDVTAEIQLPDGLSLADMLSGQQSEVMTIDKVPEDSSDSFIWYLRGDKEGEYNVSVDVSAKQMPFGDEIHCHYTTDKPVKVYAGSQMKMTITADNKAIEGYYYHVNYKLENVSPKSLYYLCLKLNSAEQWAYEDTSITVGDIPEWSFPSEGEYVLKRTDELEDYVSVDELAPGQTVEINMKVPIDFIDGEDSPLMKAFLPEKVEFLVKHFDVYTLEGSTTEIPYEIALVEPELEIVPGKDKWEDEEPTLSILKFNAPKGYYYTSKENGIKTYNFTYSFDVTKTSVDVEVTEGAEWKLYSDEKCLNLLDKTQTFSLNVKDNRWYIKITKGSESELYGINIYRRKKDGFDVKNQHYEESFSKNFEEYLENSANIYNSELSYLLMNFADAAYNKDLILQNYENAGFSFPQPYHYGEIFYGNTVGYVIGEKVVNGEKIVFVTVRGSVLGTGDWLSNFLITSATISPIPQKHEGFWIAADEIVRAIKLQTGPLSNDTKYVFTGHSRGAAIANLAALELSDLGVDSNNIYDYNFACPDNACELPTDWNPDGNHNNIINIGNLKDIVTFVPGQIVTLFKYNGILFQWGKFGRSYWFSDDFTNLMNYNLDFNAHNTNYYLDFLKSHASKAMQDLKDYFELVELKNRYRVDTIVKEVQSLYGIFCPVDFQVYDVNGVLYASVIDGQVEYSEADLNNDVVIFVYEDQKLIYVREGLKVDIKMIATDDGQMDFSAMNFDIQTGDVLKEKLFKDVQLIEGKQMEYIASIDLNIENAELLVVEDGIPVRNISTDGTETIIKYQVIYNSNGRGTAPLSSEVECNSTIAKPENPIADGYTFAGWYKESTCENPWNFDTDVVTKDITLYAKWVENVATTANYTIKHLQENLDGNGYTEVIADRQMLSGTVGEDTNASEKIYTGFTAKTVEQKAISADGNTVIEIKYERNRYTVTWKNWDETELEKDTKVPYGSTPTYDGETPTKEATAQYTYTFDGWDRTLSAVTEDVVYTAKFKETVNKYTVTFKNWDGTELKKTEVEYGSAAEAPSDPERVGYTFIGWDKAFNNIIGGLTVTAQYADKVVDVTIAVEGAGYGSISGNKATVKYGTTISADGAKLTVGNTTITATPTADTAQYAYSIKEWRGIPEDGKIVTEITITAVFERRVQNYTVTWKNEDGTILETDRDMEYGATPTYDGATPTKPSDAQYSYTFAGWDKVIAAVTGDVTYTAQFNAVVQRYTVTWKNWNGSILETDEAVAYGATPMYDGATPTKPADAQYSYAFAGWDKAITAVTGNVTYTAVFTQTVRQYKVTFDVNGHGSSPAAITVSVGQKITKPADPSASSYTFGGWYKEAACTNEWKFDSDLMPGKDITLYAKWTYSGGTTGVDGGGSSSGGGGGSSSGGSGGGATRGPGAKITTVTGAPTFSKNWVADAAGVWRIRDKDGNYVTSAWLCDDAVPANGQNVWYLMNTDGTMLAAGLVQDNTGNYYSLEMNHNGYYGMLRYTNGTYDGIYMEFSQKHDGTFGAITNQSAIDALKARYGVTRFGIGNDRCVYTKSFE